MQTHDHAVEGSSGFLPHGFCYLWDPQLLWTHVSADALIGAAYLTISLSLAWLVHRIRGDIPFSWAFVAFGLFIITCGLTHFMEIWTLWQPVYWLSGGVKVITAVASVATAVAMPFTVPRAVATVRDARLSRERELAETRAIALQEQNEKLRVQALELEAQRREAEDLAERLEHANSAMSTALTAAHDAQARAEAASQAKTVFLRTMSHELRTPLNAIIGYSQLLNQELTGPINDAQRQHLKRIDRSAEHLIDLIGEILTLSSQAGSTRPAEPVSLRALVDEVAMMVRPQARTKQLDIVAADVPDVTLLTDARSVRQVLLNLTANAVKFTRNGSVTISGEERERDVLLHVTDTGPGIAPEHLDRVFEPFWQADQGTTRTHGGSGLGLSVSLELARTLGGDLTVQSEVGRGSRFTLRLPRDTDSQA